MPDPDPYCSDVTHHPKEGSEEDAIRERMSRIWETDDSGKGAPPTERHPNCWDLICRSAPLDAQILILREAAILDQAGYLPKWAYTLQRISRQYHWFLFEPEDDGDSIQAEIVMAFKAEGIGDAFRKARMSARRALFTIIANAITGSRLSPSLSETEQSTLAAILEDPYRLVLDPELARQYADLMTSPNGLRRIADALGNAASRTQPFHVDHQGLILARHWTDPHFPLWLMQPPALAEVCPRLDRQVFWTKDTIKNKIRDLGLRRFSKKPITQLEVSSGLATFVLTNAAHQKISARRFPRPPRDGDLLLEGYVLARYKDEKAIPEDLRRVIVIVGSSDDDCEIRCYDPFGEMERREVGDYEWNPDTESWEVASQTLEDVYTETVATCIRGKLPLTPQDTAATIAELAEVFGFRPRVLYQVRASGKRSSY